MKQVSRMQEGVTAVAPSTALQGLRSKDPLGQMGLSQAVGKTKPRQGAKRLREEHMTLWWGVAQAVSRAQVTKLGKEPGLYSLADGKVFGGL